MLKRIVETKKEELTRFYLSENKELPEYSFYNALRNPKRSLALIAEVKKASPSKGIICEDFKPVEISKKYEVANVDAISVLTDEVYFKGDASYLSEIKQYVALPVLRKDFMIDRRQIIDSKHMGADAILLIAAILDVEKLYEFYLEAEELGLDCLVECHTEKEITTILNKFTPKIMGINNRNLYTFQTNLRQTETLHSYLPKEVVTISESGIQTYDDIKRLQALQVSGMLVGETLMKQKNPEKIIKQLFGEEK
ncbi:indole-3-glycerol phosphate synthase TrpC [Massilibacterium senegalense]|uniref:indole-3-glycerol phosphate synthase TrpC n=1 Tax=Massilibacterium senegalense TaxID=1632858 RepID=UPI0007819628|nr:indole-3-glycerol phosphate synthase TrpC [Massilibacterium senegalense]